MVSFVVVSVVFETPVVVTPVTPVEMGGGGGAVPGEVPVGHPPEHEVTTTVEVFVYHLGCSPCAPSRSPSKPSATATPATASTAKVVANMAKAEDRDPQKATSEKGVRRAKGIQKNRSERVLTVIDRRLAVH